MQTKKESDYQNKEERHYFDPGKGPKYLGNGIWEGNYEIVRTDSAKIQLKFFSREQTAAPGANKEKNNSWCCIS